MSKTTEVLSSKSVNTDASVCMQRFKVVAVDVEEVLKTYTVSVVQ